MQASIEARTDITVDGIVLGARKDDKEETCSVGNFTPSVMTMFYL